MRTLILMSTFLTFFLSFKLQAMELTYDYGLRHYEFKLGEDVLKMKAPGMRLTIERKKCNAETVGRFFMGLEYMMGKTSHLVFSGKEADKLTKEAALKRITYKVSTLKKQYQTQADSKLGKYLLRLPDNFVALKRIAKGYCAKKKK